MRLSEAMRQAKKTDMTSYYLSPTMPYRPRPMAREPRRRESRLVRVVAALAGAVVVLAAAGVGAFGLRQQPTTYAAADNQACTLIVPDHALTAKGLATPYQFTGMRRNGGACHETNVDQAAFVQAAILDPAAGTISIYSPLVVDRGARPAVAPVVPTLPANAVVALWFGSNGDALRLRGARGNTLNAARCVNGLGGSIFGQVAFCNASAFFTAANAAIQAGKLTPPALGTAKDGATCPSIRDFSIVDQDQSDNVTTTYLITPDGTLAQNSAANRTQLGGAAVLKNGSDNALLARAVDPVLGCTTWTVPDLTDPGAMTSAQPLEELQAAAHQQAPVALVPSADPMVLVNDRSNLQKQNLFRAGVNQPPVATRAQARADLKTYCQNLYDIAPKRMQQNETLTSAQPSPTPAVATNLFTFLAQRFVFSFEEQGLGCAKLLNMADPVQVTMNDAGVATDATINYNPPAPQQTAQGAQAGQAGRAGTTPVQTPPQPATQPPAPLPPAPDATVAPAATQPAAPAQAVATQPPASATTQPTAPPQPAEPAATQDPAQAATPAAATTATPEATDTATAGA
jgi:hypothetical protein